MRLELSPDFTHWLNRLRDRRARMRISARLDLMANGHMGDCKPVGDGVSESRIHYGPGYRLYFARVGNVVLLFLCGGDKGSQKRDIDKARQMLAAWKEQQK